MSYYYMTPDGEFVDSSQRLSDPKYIQINGQEYAITRLVVGGYSRSEIEHAVDRVFHILDRGADVRPYCRNHEIYYDFELGCPACTSLPSKTAR